MFGSKKKCEYCRNSIEKGAEIKKDVKRPGYVGTFTKNFCSDQHAESYEKELEDIPKRSGGGCCG